MTDIGGIAVSIPLSFKIFSIIFVASPLQPKDPKEAPIRFFILKPFMKSRKPAILGSILLSCVEEPMIIPFELRISLIISVLSVMLTLYNFPSTPTDFIPSKIIFAIFSVAPHIVSYITRTSLYCGNPLAH